jgi:hypothetical protein
MDDLARVELRSIRHYGLTERRRGWRACNLDIEPSQEY